MLAAKTVVPVLGVPVQPKRLSGVDSLHSIVQMPKGVPVATFAIGAAGPPMRRCLPWPCWPTKIRPCGPGSKPSAPRRPKPRAP
jgi:hypothetical protein